MNGPIFHYYYIKQVVCFRKPISNTLLGHSKLIEESPSFQSSINEPEQKSATMIFRLFGGPNLS